MSTTKDGLINTGKIPSAPTIPSPPPKQAGRGSIHAEIEQIRRIVNGANKRLERLSNELKK